LRFRKPSSGHSSERKSCATSDGPELKERFETFDLFNPRIDRLCLNHHRLYLDGCRNRPDRPHAAVQGTVANPPHTPQALAATANVRGAA
jgi:hypothetical protein